MFDRLESIRRRYSELEELLLRDEIALDRKEFARLARERSSLEEVVARIDEWQKLQEDLMDTQVFASDKDPEMRELGRAELEILREREVSLRDELRMLLLPHDPNDERNVLLEIRAGTGGDEAGLFAADLYRMYSRYAERKGWRIEPLSSSETGLGGFKEIIALVEGKGAWSRLKFESGVHRVQRVPVTEGSGRIHTSAVTVAVMPEADDVEVEIVDKDLRVEVMRASGPGGQSVNTTDSAVRITHEPSGIAVSCRDEKSQHKNKAKAMKILRARLLKRAEEEQRSSIAAKRKGLVGSGDRSERIRTYNFPQARITDHRINFTLHSLERGLDGEIDDLIDELVTSYQAEALAAQETE